MSKETNKQIKVTYVKSAIGRIQKQRRTLKSLGLKKLNSHNILPDNASVRGSINKVKHLLKVEEIN